MWAGFYCFIVIFLTSGLLLSAAFLPGSSCSCTHDFVNHDESHPQIHQIRRSNDFFLGCSMFPHRLQQILLNQRRWPTDTVFVSRLTFADGNMDVVVIKLYEHSGSCWEIFAVTGRVSLLFYLCMSRSDTKARKKVIIVKDKHVGNFFYLDFAAEEEKIRKMESVNHH